MNKEGNGKEYKRKRNDEGKVEGGGGENNGKRK
jgi:hypothetical protein